MATEDGSEDVKDFLARIRDLGDQRDQEDADRQRRKLDEEEILKNRQERAARRAERARSISPTKGSPATTVGSAAAVRSAALDTPTSNASAAAAAAAAAAAEMSPAKQVEDAPASSPLNLEPSKPDPPARSSSTLSRSNTLSWQQRPSSRTSTTVRSRPLSVVATENSSALRSPSATPEPTTTYTIQSSTQEKETEASEATTTEEGPATGARSTSSLSNHPMASMLADKDPSWFRQTADRGKGSAAYRKSEEPESGPVSRSGSVRMPGMSGSGDNSATPAAGGSGSVRGRPKSVIGGSIGLGAVRLEPTSNDKEPGSDRTPAMSPAQGRISPERPSSPTKGLGGFVQSAMLKRSDSVTKRWSAQAPTGLSRGNSTAGNLASRDLGADLPLRPGNTRSPSPAKQESPVEEQEAEDEEAQASAAMGKEEVRKSRSPPPDISTSRPSSPTKDTRRWSPVKSSWLENAISKQDSPAPPKAATPQQPAWMVELQKAKAARASVDIKKPEPSPSAAPASSSVRGPRPLSVIGNNKGKPTVPAKPPGDSVKKEELSDEVATSEPAAADDRPTSEVKPESTPKGTETPAASKKDPSPPVTKPKPETPPKKDFRANLRPRSVADDKAAKEEPEFRKAFGNLKRAETRSYKAPDTLKENITRGKAGLAVTGGPQKTERVDEFKESILAKKKDFAATPTKPPVKNPSQTADKPVPEALARRSGMLSRSKSISAGSQPTSPEKKPEEKPAAIQQQAQIKNSALAARFNPNLAGILARGPPAASSSSSPERAPASVQTSTTSDATAKVPELTHATKGRARGPKRKPPSAKGTDASAAKSKPISAPATPKPQASSLGAIQPVSGGSSASFRKTSVPSSERSKPSLPASSASGKSNVDEQLREFNAIKSSLVGDGKDLGLVGLAKSDKPIEATRTPDVSTPPKPKPAPPKSSSNRVSSFGSSPPAGTPPKAKTFPPSTTVTSSPSSKPSVTAPKPTTTNGKTASDGRPSTPAKKTVTSPTVTKTPPVKITPKPNTLSPEIKREASSDSPLPLHKARAPSPEKKPSSNVVPDRFKTGSQSSPAKVLGSQSPAVPAKSAAARNFSSSKQALNQDEAKQVIEDFFGPIPPSNKARPSVDAAAILQAAARTPDKIRTLRKQIWELTPDGKRLPMPAQQEYMLFEDCMYVCAHVFGSSTGKHTTEAYMWVGSGVSPSAAEDAQLFARNAAKEVGATGKLTVLQQGKETGNFFEALGGIVVVRRGSSKGSDAKYMLCGRKHMGQMAFDEVDFGSRSLCSGFPFIIAAMGGKLYLWKGRGSGADELGCARLIAMDLGLTGDIEEIDDGSEPDAFWKVFGSRDVDEARIGGHWPHKANKEKYITRLFVIDDARPRSAGLGALWGRRGSTPSGNGNGGDEPGTADVHEIAPFAQSDLAQDGIYVLDAYFEVYIILCWRSTARFPAYKSAMHFAQEYAIVAASEEDRPFVPAAHVVFAGSAPPYLRTSFRRWDESRVTTQPVGAAASEAQTVPLHEAIAAVMG